MSFRAFRLGAVGNSRVAILRLVDGAIIELPQSEICQGISPCRRSQPLRKPGVDDLAGVGASIRGDCQLRSCQMRKSRTSRLLARLLGEWRAQIAKSNVAAGPGTNFH